MNLIETNHQIKINSDHSGSSNNSFKVMWMLKVSTCSSHCSSRAKHADSALVPVTRVMWMYKGDMNSTSGENWKEPSIF